MCQAVRVSGIQNEVLIQDTTRTNLKKIMLSERRQTQRTTCCMITFICNVQKRKIYRNRKQTSRGQGLGMVVKSDCKWAWGVFAGWRKCSKTGLWWWLYNSKFTKSCYLYTFNQWILSIVTFQLTIHFCLSTNISWNSRAVLVNYPMTKQPHCPGIYTAVCSDLTCPLCI